MYIYTYMHIHIYIYIHTYTVHIPTYTYIFALDRFAGASLGGLYVQHFTLNVGCAFI